MRFRLTVLVDHHAGREQSTYRTCHKPDMLFKKTNIQRQMEEHPDYPSLLAPKNIGVEP